jgi:hypothetical protein
VDGKIIKKIIFNSLKISGPACGLDCHKIPVNQDLVAQADNISSKDHEDLCEDLCEYGLGV